MGILFLSPDSKIGSSHCKMVKQFHEVMRNPRYCWLSILIFLEYFCQGIFSTQGPNPRLLRSLALAGRFFTTGKYNLTYKTKTTFSYRLFSASPSYQELSSCENNLVWMLLRHLKYFIKSLAARKQYCFNNKNAAISPVLSSNPLFHFEGNLWLHWAHLPKPG